LFLNINKTLIEHSIVTYQLNDLIRRYDNVCRYEVGCNMELKAYNSSCSVYSRRLVWEDPCMMDAAQKIPDYHFLYWLQ